MSAPMSRPGGHDKTDNTYGTPVLVGGSLEKHFGANEALRGATLTVHAGEIAGLVGGNGAGKSACEKCICGALTPDAGEILFNGNTAPPGNCASYGAGQKCRPAQNYPNFAATSVGLGLWHQSSTRPTPWEQTFAAPRRAMPCLRPATGDRRPR